SIESYRRRDVVPSRGSSVQNRCESYAMRPCVRRGADASRTQTRTSSARTSVRSRRVNGDNLPQMDAQLMEALAEILADALITDLETEEEQALTGVTAESPRGTGSRVEQPPATSARTPDAA